MEPNELYGSQHTGDVAATIRTTLTTRRNRHWPTLKADLPNLSRFKVIQTNSQVRPASHHLKAFLGDQPEKDVVEAAVQQTVLTHNSPETIESTTFLATAAYGSFCTAVNSSKRQPPHLLLPEQVKAVLDLGAVGAIAPLDSPALRLKPCP